MALLSTPILLATGALPLPGHAAMRQAQQECVFVTTPPPFPSETEVCTPPWLAS